MSRRRLSDFEQFLDEENDSIIEREIPPPTTVTSSHFDPVAFEAIIDDLLQAPPSPYLQLATTEHHHQQQQQIQVTKPPYVPRTLHEYSDRYRILPAYPSLFHVDKPPLLLANVPMHKLNEEQLARRRSAAYKMSYIRNPANFGIESCFLSDQDELMTTLIYKYNIDEPVLDFNMGRFKNCYRMFIDDYCSHNYRCSSRDFELRSDQKQYAFEFYIQMDADLFFMKTCSFRSAKPRSEDEGLYCIDEPDVRYGFAHCNNCSLCVPSMDPDCQQQTTIRYGPTQKFRFINGYEAILNCPADCQTQNILYVLTCPCKDAEYIGQTSQRLGDRLWYHRQHFNRIIHEFLIGEENVKLSQQIEKDAQTITKDRMRLYRHAARCPWSIQIFLKYNPIYWCFIPVTASEAMEHDRTYILPSSLIIHDNINPTSIGSRYRQDIQEKANTRSDEQVRSCMRQLPPLPSNYTFSIRQRVGQFQYFKNNYDMNIQPNSSIDIFNASILVVFPIDAIEIVRRFVEALFITHTETNLNRDGRLFSNEESDNNSNTIPMNEMSIEAQIQDRGNWCHNAMICYEQHS